jgi:hypothetical protein
MSNDDVVVPLPRMLPKSKSSRPQMPPPVVVGVPLLPVVVD